MIAEIPLIDANDFIVETDLSGITYFLHLSWNSEGRVWFLAIENSLNEVVVTGIRLVPEFDLLGTFRHLQVPDGLLWVSSAQGRIDRDCFINGNASLLYDDLIE